MVCRRFRKPLLQERSAPSGLSGTLGPLSLPPGFHRLGDKEHRPVHLCSQENWKLLEWQDHGHA